MKLSEKGLDKIYGLDFEQANGSPFEFEALEFDKDDFKGAVVLTVEEAKICCDAMQVSSNFASETGLIRIKNCFDNLLKQIEQAEKNND